MPSAAILFNHVLYAIFPRRCLSCGKVVAPDKEFCAGCAGGISRIQPPVCNRCGRGAAECDCGGRASIFTALAAPFYYEGSVRRCIQRLKFGGYKQNAGMLAYEMARTVNNAFRDKQIDGIACVPLTKKGLRERGYNQSALLAAKLGKILGVETLPKTLVKLYDTPAQHTLKSYERTGNVAGAFAVPDNSRVAGKSILLCDDVSTTGATLNECAKMLLLAGAKDVFCVTAALTKKELKK